MDNSRDVSNVEGLVQAPTDEKRSKIPRLRIGARPRWGGSSIGSTRQGETILALAIGAAATVVSLIGSWRVSMWTDEAATISATRRSLPELWDLLQRLDAVHGVYYAVMQAWIGIFGASAVSMRFPSAIAVGIGAAGVYMLARTLANSSIGVVAAALFSIMPRVTWMGIEARPYAASAAIAVWLTVLLLAALGRSRVRWWVAYAVLGALAVAVNIYVGLVLVAHGTTVLLVQRVRWRQKWTLLMAAAAAGMLAAPVWYAAVRERGQVGESEFGWMGLIRNAVVNQWFLGGTPTGGVQGDSGDGMLWKLAAVGLAGICWLVMIHAVVARRKIDCVGGHLGIEVLDWLLPQIALPTLVIGAYSLLVDPMYSARYLSFCAPFVAVLLGIGLFLLPSRWQRCLAGSLIVILTVPIYVSQRQEYAKSGADWSAVARFIGNHGKPHQAVYFSPCHPSENEPIGKTTRQVKTAYPDAFQGIDDLTLVLPGSKIASLVGRNRPLPASVDKLGGVSTVWVVRPRDYPSAIAESEAQLLRHEGFRPDVTWVGPSSAVTGLSR